MNDNDKIEIVSSNVLFGLVFSSVKLSSRLSFQNQRRAILVDNQDGTRYVFPSIIDLKMKWNMIRWGGQKLTSSDKRELWRGKTLKIKGIAYENAFCHCFQCSILSTYKMFQNCSTYIAQTNTTKLCLHCNLALIISIFLI